MKLARSYVIVSNVCIVRYRFRKLFISPLDVGWELVVA